MMMLDDSISSPTFWSSLTSWFTPTIFFLLLQLVIATIYIISSLSNNNASHHKHQNEHHQQHHPLEPNNLFQQQNPLPRSPSLLHRLKSINFYYHHTHHEPQQQQQQQQYQHEHHQQHPHEPNNLFQQQQQQNPLPRSPSLLHRLKSINFYNRHSHHEQQQQQPPPQILRSPSSVLQKLKSINLCSYLPKEPLSSFLATDTNITPHEKTHVREIEIPLVKQQQYQLEEEQEEDEGEKNDVVGEIHYYSNHHEREFSNSTMDEIFSRLQEGQNGNFARTNSDTKPSSGEVPVKLARKMKKSASTKSAFSHFEEVDIVERRRPATVREGGAAVKEEGDGGVDAKADDFINRFKQQLKLQRLDSIMRYKEMIGGGSGK